MTTTKKNKLNKSESSEPSSTNNIRRKTYQYRLYPTPAQEKALLRQLEACRILYNIALDERRTAYRNWERENKGASFTILSSGVTILEQEVVRFDAPNPPRINYYSQANQLKEIRTVECFPELLEVNFSACQDVLKRVDKAFTAFFDRVKSGKKAGYPRFKSKSRYDSITWPSYRDGCKLKASGKLYIQNVGIIRMRQHRNVGDTIKTVTIRREGLHNWYVSFSCQYEFEAVEKHTGPVVGLDVGLEYFGSLSNGETIANPRFFRKSEMRLAKAQRKLSRLKALPYTSPKKRKARKAVALAHKKIRNQRRDFQHKQALMLVRQYNLIVVEDLHIRNLTRRPHAKFDSDTGEYLPNGASAKSGLAKSITDAGWGNFIQILSNKAEDAGSLVIKVSPNGTSQTCPDCGAATPKDLSERWHNCPECGCSLPRDVVAARNILTRGLTVRRVALYSIPDLIGRN